MPAVARRALRAVLPLLLLLPLSGCFHFGALLVLDADGGGTIEETITIDQSARSMLMMGRDSTAGPPVIYNVDSLQAHAAELGEGVTFVRVDTVSDAASFGYRAVYRFEDIDAVRYRFSANPIQVPGQSGSTSRSSGLFFAAMSAELPITFQFAPGRLTVRMPQPEGSGASATLDQAEVTSLADSLRLQMGAGGGAMARQAMSDAGYSVSVVLPGAPTSSTATHITDDLLTLVDFNFGAMFDVVTEKPELVARAQILERRGTPDTRPVLRAIAARPGVRYELQPEVEAQW